MAMATIRSNLLRAAFRGASRNPAQPKRGFASSAHDDAHCKSCKVYKRMARKNCIQECNEDETAKWEKITYAGIATCTILAFYNLSKGHPHHEDPPAYPYLHIRNKEFPWGPDGLFEVKHH